jgi:hypothetical protein
MVDWSTVDVDQLQSEWQSDLDASYRHTVDSLAQAAIDSRALLPFLDQTTSNLQTLSSQYQEYCRQLEAMAAAVQGIQEMNRGLTLQSENMAKLLSVVDALPFMQQHEQHYAQAHDDVAGWLDKPEMAGRVADRLAQVGELIKKEDPDLVGMLAMREWRASLQLDLQKTSSLVSDYLCNV